jgi:hypothetical protein
MPKVPDCVQRIRTYRQYPTYGTTLRVDIHFSRELMDLRLSCNLCFAPHDLRVGQLDRMFQVDRTSLELLGFSKFRLAAGRRREARCCFSEKTVANAMSKTDCCWLDLWHCMKVIDRVHLVRSMS